MLNTKRHSINQQPLGYSVSGGNLKMKFKMSHVYAINISWIKLLLRCPYFCFSSLQKWMFIIPVAQCIACCPQRAEVGSYLWKSYICRLVPYSYKNFKQGIILCIIIFWCCKNCCLKCQYSMATCYMTRTNSFFHYFNLYKPSLIPR